VREELIGKGRTILLATHILADAEELCDRVAIIDEGKIVTMDTTNNLKERVRGIETMDLEVLTDKELTMVEALRALDGVKACSFSSAISGDKVASFKIHTPDSRSLLPSLIDAIQRMDGKVRYVRVSEPTLEDVFIHYRGRGLSD
jgi:ABC-2 type transport system ATP-binding protein